MKPEIIEKRPLNISLVREEIKKIKKRDGEELNFRATKTEEYLKEVAKIKAKDAKELAKKLEELKIPRLKPAYIQKIIDVLPLNEKHLKVVLQGYTLSVNAENQKKIFKVVKEYLPKKAKK